MLERQIKLAQTFFERIIAIKPETSVLLDGALK
jgi:hypothetical protein